ncbi:hypothetical protein [Tateyamaria pelophila]|uniref:hypothetical protein n=1 Tax=Tateyamaria pelophila TaxID=328415 RepID=UPI001CBD880D|nr:hypothetical protein [Tateyamaria pelophila]
MKHILRSNQRHDIYRKYHVQDSEIRDLLGECGFKEDEEHITYPLSGCSKVIPNDGPLKTEPYPVVE